MYSDKGVNPGIIKRHFRDRSGYTSQTAAAEKRIKGHKLSGGQRDLEAFGLVQSTRPLRQGQCSMPIWLALYDGS